MGKTITDLVRNEMTIEIKPCPFCGESWTIICETDYIEGKSYTVSCRTKGCAGAIYSLGFGLFETVEKAVVAWNIRNGILI